MGAPLRARRWALIASAGLAACAGTPSGADVDRIARETIRGSFREQGIAKLDRLEQDAVQQVCSAPTAPAEAVTRALEAAALATIEWPKDGVYLGDWREGEKLAQNGRGMTWTDPPGVPSGGNCYNCHQMAKSEISFGTLGPSLLAYGRLRGVTDPLAPAAAPIVQYTWGKLWNSKAYSACSAMPRFGHSGVLTQGQIRDLMALLLDPKSPVNAP
jgi:sulfur-oxidizing protein SoxX